MKTKRTLLNAVFSALNLLITAVLSLVATRTILVYLGSDYNGLNSTITQFLSLLLLLESGFTVAALVKLYKPYADENLAEIDGILSKTNIILKKVGILMLIFGATIAAVYAIFIKTDISYPVVLILFLFSIFSTAFNFAYTYKFRLLFQVSQTEYVIHIINCIMHTFMYLGTILLVRFTQNIILARFYYMLCNILFGCVIGFVAKKHFPKVNFKAPCENVQIDGNKELLVSRFAGLMYNFLTVFFLSIVSGTILTSVYAVYNSIIAIVVNYVNVLFTSPRNALGQVINAEKNRVRKILLEYEYIVILIAGILFSTTTALIIPFVRIYTADLADAQNYIVPIVALIIVLISVTQLIHIPSGQCIELSGQFKTVRNNQLIMVASLGIFSIVGGIMWGLIGLLLAKLLTNCALAFLEIRYAHIKVVPNSIVDFLKILLPNLTVITGITVLEYIFLFDMSMGYIKFFAIAILTLIVNTALIVLFNFVFYRNMLRSVIVRILSIFKKKKSKLINN